MKKIQLLSILFFFIFISVSAQDTIQTRIPFSEPRFHYFVRTLVFFNEYLDTPNGSFNTTQARVLLPIGNKAWNLRFDLPLISTNTTSENKTGIGDVGAGISYIPLARNENGIAFRARVYGNTASDPNFGSGKWVFMPAVFYAKYFCERKFLWISSLEYQVSFAGSQQRNDVGLLAYENALYHFFGRNWIAADVAFRYNNISKGYQNNAYVEFGRKITPINLVYIHPSVAFGGSKSYNFGIEAGLLVLF